MLLIVGLGNPGTKYEKQRHNVGFMAVDEIHRHESFSTWKPKFQALTAEGQVAGQKVLLMKPTTFMNESGRSVGEAARFYKVETGDVVVLYDELDLAAGKIRVKTGGGSGGHNGIRSLETHLGKDFRRVRIGIGHPGHKDRVTGHVLGDFAKSDRQWLEPLLDEIGRNGDYLVRGDDAGFMNRMALATQSVESSKETGAPRGRPGAKKKSHIHKANKNGPKPKVPTSGPMADMLKKLFGGNDG